MTDISKAQRAKVISDRTLDNKTISLNDEKTAIEVKISDDSANAVKVNADGIFVERANILITDLAGNPLGQLYSHDDE